MPAPRPLLPTDLLSIGQLAHRTGLSVSAIRFYEERGLIAPTRNPGRQRRFFRSDIRRLSFVLIAQQLGFSIAEIRKLLAGLPEGRTPNVKDWSQISAGFRRDLDNKIAALTRMRDNLDSCIGCGCLSLKKCQLYNPADRARKGGSGPRYLRDPIPIDRCRGDGVLMCDDTFAPGVDLTFDWRVCLLLSREPEVVRMHVLRDIEDHSIIRGGVIAPPLL